MLPTYIYITRRYVPATTPPEALLCPTYRTELGKYRELPKVKQWLDAGKPVFLNLVQDALERPVCSVRMPCLTTKPKLWGIGPNMDREMLASEHFGVQMLPFWPDDLIDLGLVSPLVKWPASSLAQKRMTGNAMNVTMVGGVLMWALSTFNVVRR